MSDHVSVQDVRDAFTLIPGTRDHSERQGRVFDQWLKRMRADAWHSGAWAQKQSMTGAVNPYRIEDVA